MERASLDSTPYTPEQLDWLPQAYGVISDTWSDVNEDGLKLTRSPGRFGDVWSLCIDDFNWMNTNPVDLLDHRTILKGAVGDVLLTGLGLGLGVIFANANPNISSITVIESDWRVHRHVLPMVARRLQKPARIFVADADTYDYSKESYDFAFIDHAREAPPTDTVEKIGACSRQVVVWWNEAHEVLASWR